MAITAREARKNLRSLITQVKRDRRPVTITTKGRRCRGDARADYDALEDAAFSLRVPANARRLA